MKKQWVLESVSADGTRSDFVITQLPCRIGRSKGNDLVIANLGLSRDQAVIARDITGQLRLAVLSRLHALPGASAERRPLRQ